MRPLYKIAYLQITRYVRCTLNSAGCFYFHSACRLLSDKRKHSVTSDFREQHSGGKCKLTFHTMAYYRQSVNVDPAEHYFHPCTSPLNEFSSKV